MPSRSRGPRRRGRPARKPQELTSLPTSRNAYNETREWLLKTHGPVCAYCERKIRADRITLDHVTPRKGKTAYDRRDNLVLACPACNIDKADKSFLAFLLARKSRAAAVLRYGSHLSGMLIKLASDIAGPEATARAARLADPDYPYLDRPVRRLLSRATTAGANPASPPHPSRRRRRVLTSPSRDGRSRGSREGARFL